MWLQVAIERNQIVNFFTEKITDKVENNKLTDYIRKLKQS